MSVHTQIEIPAAPEDVRRIFLDFANWHKIKDKGLRSIEPVAGEAIAPGEVGSHLRCDINGIKSVCVVTENTPTHIAWHGDILLVLSGDHRFGFLPSEVTPGHTTFTNSEKFARLLGVLVGSGLLKVEADYVAFGVNLKRRVEEVLAEEKRAKEGA